MLQFGPSDPSISYRLRPAVFGIARQNDLIACVRVERGDASYLDLPGGAVDGDETEAEALAREFREETGLVVRPETRFGEASQRFFKTTGEALNNTGGFWTVSVEGHRPQDKVEDDHTLVWLEPERALARLRHDAHAWAVTLWLRGREAGVYGTAPGEDR